MQSIKITLQPSYVLLGVLLSISMLACVSVIIVAIPFWIKLCLLATIIFTGTYFILRDALQALPWSWQVVEVSASGELRLTNLQGQQVKPALHATTLIHPWLVILNLKKAESSRWYALPLNPVLVLPNAKEQHRQLRVWLKWWQHQSKLVSSH